MGIKYLNRFLQENCKEAIKKISLNELSGKKIVIDASIYMYRYLTDNVLLENIYLMIGILRKYNIVALFVFDGKPPKEKEDLLKERKRNKKIAEEKYKDLQNKLDNKKLEENEKEQIKEDMNQLKKQFIRLHHTDIENVKILIQSLGVSYIDAPGEADKLCAKMVNKGLAYACLSEDMDMFVYGCKRVLRYLSLLNKTVIIYEMKQILIELDINFNDFKTICVISGTSYNG
jgi:flap endonuclease-1